MTQHLTIGAMNVTPVTTNRAEATAVILAAYDAKTLPAQYPNVGGVYSRKIGGVTVRCAIGHLFTPEDAKTLESSDEYMMANGLITNKLLIIPTGEREWFEEVQRTHDDWARYGDGPYHIKFLEMLGR